MRGDTYNCMCTSRQVISHSLCNRGLLGHTQDFGHHACGHSLSIVLHLQVGGQALLCKSNARDALLPVREMSAGRVRVLGGDDSMA
jgi:hypothetical protein